MKGTINFNLLVGGLALGACHLLLFCMGFTTLFDLNQLGNARAGGVHIFGIYLFVRIFCAWWCSIVALRMNRNRWCWFIIVFVSFIPGVIFLALLGYTYPSDLKVKRSKLKQEYYKKRSELRNLWATGVITKEELDLYLGDLSLRLRIRMGDLEEKYALMQHPELTSLDSAVLEDSMNTVGAKIILIEDSSPTNEDVLDDADTGHHNSDLHLSS